MKKLLLTVVAYLSMCYTSWGDDSRLIRRLYLDTVGMPPTIEEIEWYISYNTTKGYELAVNWVLTKYGEEKLRSYFLSNEYKQATQTEIPQEVLDNIIKYQVGKLYLTNQQADDELIKIGLNAYTDPLDIIDYFAMCMMSRVTHIDEANELLKIYRSFKTDKEGYRCVLAQMKTYRDYKYK